LSDRKGIRLVKKLGVVDCSFAHLMAPTVTTTSVILSSNIIQNEDILIPANTGTPGNMVIKMKSSR